MTIDTKRLRELAEAATPGPWKEQHWKGAPDGCVYSSNEWVSNASVENASFIAAANPQTVIALLDEIDAFRSIGADPAAAWLECSKQLAAMTAARDEACDIAEAATFVIDNGLCNRCSDSIQNVGVERLDALRKVGT